PVFVTRPEPMTSYVGKPARFQCAVTGSPPMNIVWQKAGLDISSDGNYKISTDKKKNILEIPSLQLDNKGIYSCKATNAFGTDICSCELRVIDKPQFVKKLEPLPVAVGHIIRLECQVDEDTGVCITWSRDGKKLHLSMDYKITFEEKVAVLEIPNAKLKDSGNYVCTASNDAGSSTCSASVTVRGKHGPQDNLDSIKGSFAHLECLVSGSLPLSVTWYKDDKEITASEKYKSTLYENTALLEIIRLDSADSGSYTCVATNKAGREQCAGHLTVKEKPSPPERLGVTDVTKQSVSLSWSKPEHDGGSRITSYLIDALEKGQQKWVKCAVVKMTHHVVRGLKENVEYFFRVCAENQAGLSEPKEMLFPVTVKDQLGKLSHTSKKNLLVLRY
ncbi:hypothetical protein AOXY_G12747, partial [Acipenser oxyrinchus oxyrinchus]